LAEFCRQAKDHFQVAVALVTLLSQDRLIAKARAATDLEVAAHMGQFCDITIRSDDVFVVPDAN
jgi:hypothetical protein